MNIKDYHQQFLLATVLAVVTYLAFRIFNGPGGWTEIIGNATMGSLVLYFLIGCVRALMERKQ